MLQDYLTDLYQKITASLPNLFFALLILGVSMYLARLVGALVSRALARKNVAVGISHLLTQMLKAVVIVFGVITALQRFFDVTAFLAGLGILGFAIGFALQDIMQNFVSGVILLVQQPFRVGEYVKAADYAGTVSKIDLRATEIKTVDGLTVFLPNADVLSHAITNYTRAGSRRAELSFGVAYDTDLNKATKTILKAIKATPLCAKEPQPQVLFHTFGASSINLTIYFWVDTQNAIVPAAIDAALRNIKTALERDGIEIPYPIHALLLPDKKIRIGS